MELIRKPLSMELGVRATVLWEPRYLEVHCTYNLLSNCSYNLNISPIITVTLNIIGL